MGNEFADFLQTAGLYDTIEVTQANLSSLKELLDGKVRLNLYCKECGQNSVFIMQPIMVSRPSTSCEDNAFRLSVFPLSQQNIKDTSGNGKGQQNNSETTDWCFVGPQVEMHYSLITFRFCCAVNPAHRLDYVVRTYGYTMKKIGQYPSVADLAFPEVDEFKKVIDNTTRKELRKAIGLHAQGIGVGSYVYLRRIFERILDEAKDHAERDGAIDLSTYSIMKVQDRMKLLRAYLPEMINSNPIFYGIVSKGIHELSEEDCIKYFPVLKEAIFMILRQWNQKRQEIEAAKRLTSALSGISAELKSHKM